MIMIIEYQGLCWGYTVSPFSSDIRILDMNIWAFMDIPTWMCVYIYYVWGCNLLPVGSSSMGMQWRSHGNIMGILMFYGTCTYTYIYIYTYI
jgi:hypothetical protein